MKSILAALVLVVASFAETGFSTVVGAERTRNLRGLDYAPMLFEYHRQTVGEGNHFFTYPRRDTTFQKIFIRIIKMRWLSLKAIAILRTGSPLL